MKYLAIFQLEDFKVAESFASQTAAETFIKNTAKKVKAKALQNSETKNFLLTFENDTNVEIAAQIESVDTDVKYALAYHKDGELVETTYHASRKAAVTQATKILDQNGYEASPAETGLGRWSVNNSEQNLHIELELDLVLLSSSDTVVETYRTVDLVWYFKNHDTAATEIAAAGQVANADLMKSARKKGITNLLVGLGIAALGGILSLVSYNTAKPGERYTIYTGFIAVGVVDAIIGLYYLINPKAALPKDKKK